MFDDFAPKLAHVLTTYSIPIQPGDYVIILTTTGARPLVEALYEAILRRGGHPRSSIIQSNEDELLLRLGNDDQLAFSDPLALDMIEKADVLFQILAPTNTKTRAGIPTERLTRYQEGRRPMLERYFARITDKSLRWNITAWPTMAGAQQAEMGLLAYTEFIYKACGLDHDDPVAYWTRLRERQVALVDWLAGKKHAEVHGPGVEMSFDFTDRPWVNSYGTVNFPDGEIFTSPIEDSVNGHIAFSYPAFYDGRQVDGVRLTFEKGRVVEASADKGEDFLLSQLDVDEGARTLGEFAIGTNDGIRQFTSQVLFDEKIGGSIHMAVGESIDESKGVNKSSIHWDMIHSMRDGGEIVIDGELFYQSGKFMVLD